MIFLPFSGSAPESGGNIGMDGAPQNSIAAVQLGADRMDIIIFF
jgi:hypothetical protein